MYTDNYRRNLINYWRQFYPQWDIPNGYHVHHIKPKCTFNDQNNPLIHHPKNLIALHPDDHISIHKCRGDKAVAGMLWSIKGRVISDATRLKMSISQKLVVHKPWGSHSEETKRKIGLVHKGKVRTLEERQKQSESIMGEKHHLYGKPMSEITKQKISIANIGKIRTEEYKKLRSKLSSKENNGMYGKRHRTESKKLMSEKALGANNHQFTGWYITPFGRLVSSTHQEFISSSTLINYCKQDRVITNRMYKSVNYLHSLGPDIVGKNLSDIGFTFEKIKEK